MRLLAVAVLAFITVGCTDTDMAHLSSYGNQSVVRLYAADGHVIQEWTSAGQVLCTAGGVCDFMEAKTGMLVRTTGDIVVTVQPSTRRPR